MGETGDVLRNRVTVHKQQIRDPHTRMLGVSKQIDECATGLKKPHFLKNDIIHWNISKTDHKT